MREKIVLCILVLCTIAFIFEEYATETVSAGDRISIGDYNLSIEGTFDSLVSARWQSFGFIVDEDDCEPLGDSDFQMCVEETTNTSATVRIDQLAYNLTLTHTVSDETVEVGEEITIAIRIENYAPKTEVFTAQVETNASIIEFGQLSGALRWQGNIGPSNSKYLEYTALAVAEGTFEFNITVSGAGFTETASDEVEVTDFIGFEVDYEQEITAKKKYNFSFTITNEETTPVNTSIDITLPKQIIIDDRGTLGNATEGKLKAIDELNGSENLEHWFIYRTNGDLDGEFSFVIDSEKNNSNVERLYNYPVTSSEFKHLYLLHDNEGRKVPVGKTTALQVQIVNVNNKTVSADFIASSALVNLTQTYSVPAKNSTIIDLDVNPSRAGDYGISIMLSYKDLFDEKFTDDDFIRIVAEGDLATQEDSGESETQNESQNVQAPQEEYDVSITAPAALGAQETAVVELIIANLNETVHVLITQNDTTIFEDDVDEKVTLEVTGPGYILAKVTSESGRKGAAFAKIEAPKQEEQQPVEEQVIENQAVEKKSNLSRLLPPLGLLAGILVVLFAAATVIKHHVEQREQQLLEQEQVLMSLIGGTQQEQWQRAQMYQELEQEIGKLEKIRSFFSRGKR